jgi:uncharacterized RDD family membrane protein YckC
MEQTSPDSSQSPSILGLDNIRLDLPVASIGNRVLAAFLDHLLLFFLLSAVAVLSVLLLTASEIGRTIAFTIWMVVMFSINWGYFAVSEIMLDGQTIGKKVLKLRGVSQEGGAPSISSLMIRNFLRLIDNFIGLILIAVDPKARRLGDRLAGTLVVHDQVHQDEVALSRVPKGWGSREVTLVESFLTRCPTLEPAQRLRLAERIIAWIERDDPQFLEGVFSHQDPSETVREAFRPERL